jgi:hypothetical protein
MADVTSLTMGAWLRAKSSRGSHKVIKSNQLRAAPPAGSTTLFQIAAWCRSTRHLTSQAHTTLAASATKKGAREKLCTKPGTSRATLAAGFAGKPVCMEIQTTQITKALPVKKIRVNQSINAPTLRLSVGKAKAANAASAGRASNRDRSAARVVRVATLATATNQRGSHR